MCNVKAPYVPCGSCQADKVNVTQDKLQYLIKKANGDEAVEKLLVEAFNLAKSLNK